MPAVEGIPVLKFAGKAVAKLRHMPVLEFDGAVYADALADLARQNTTVAENLVSGMGLHKKWITPEAIIKSPKYRDVFTPSDALNDISAGDISAAIYEAKVEGLEDPKAVTAFQYLVNPKMWKNQLFGFFGIGSGNIAKPNSTEIFVAAYGGGVQKEVESPTGLAFMAKIAENARRCREINEAHIAECREKGLPLPAWATQST